MTVLTEEIRETIKERSVRAKTIERCPEKCWVRKSVVAGDHDAMRFCAPWRCKRSLPAPSIEIPSRFGFSRY